MSIQYNITSLKNVINHDKFKNNDKIFVCFYKISKNNDTLPFLQYLLYKYPQTHTKQETFVFPFSLFKKGKNPITIADKLAHSLSFKKNLEYKGFISNSFGHYFFYNYLDNTINLEFKNRNYELWWGLIDEICNKKKIVNFPVHKSVYRLFYQNPDLIHITDNGNIIETPIVAFFGGSSEIISYVASIGMRLNAEKAYGSYYYLGSYESQINNAGWSPNNRIIHYFDKPASDENGKLKNGGLIRYALFLGNSRTILYRKTDPFYWYIKYLESKDFDQKIQKKADLAKGKWAEKYDSLFISKIKYENIDGYYNINPIYIVKKFSQQVPISIHSLDTTTLKSNWDPFFNKYYIK
jgi:hypothetical protein